MAIRLQESGEVIISAKAGVARPYLMQLTSWPMKDWEIADVRILPSAVTRNGKWLKQITITFDADISEQSETTYSIKS